MHIFQQEYDDGLDAQITTSASISYASLVNPCLNESFLSKAKNLKSIASINDSDLYYVQSILVTSSWNKNDDIFDKLEVWTARNTPEDKPTNLEHDENIIIGHIISNWPITEEGLLIDENTPVDNLPDKYHILTGSVIYKGFSDPDLKNRSEKLISEIESSQKYVSMECFFNGFDYGLIDKETKAYKVLSRNNETAYLTKHLRAYGGLGEHENYKIGRVLRNITFSGKGYVDKPANPDSIIFTKNTINKSVNNISEQEQEEKKAIFSFGGVSNNQSILNTEKSIMNDIETVLKDVAEIKTKVESMADYARVAKEAYETASVLKDQSIELQNVIASSNIVKAELEKSLEAAELDKEEAAKKMKEEMATKEEDVKKMKAELDSALETVAAYKDKEEKMMKAEKKMKRMATLIEGGIESEIASSTVDKLESLDDEAFEAITTLVSAKMPPFLLKKFEEDKKKKDEEEKEEAMMMKKKAEKLKEEEAMMKKKASEENTNPEVLETAEVDENDINLSVGGEEESSLESTRAALMEFVESRLGKKL
jgi:hypothetical protein